MRLLSISIAAYNVEQYLEQTLKSFCIPDIMDKIEVLIIDDGSVDGTHLIAEKFQEEYPETFKYIKKDNGGHGSTVNKGIEISHGKYFKVVDGDDWVDREAFVRLVKYLETSDEDLVLTDFCRVGNSGEKKKEEYFTQFEKGRVYTTDNIPHFESIAMHSICVKSEILKNNNIRLTEKCFYVDIEYVVYILSFINTIVYLPYDVYMYRYGTPNQSVNINNMCKNIWMREKISLGLAEYITEYNGSMRFNKKRYELMKNKVVRMISGTCLVYLAFENLKEAKQGLINYEISIKSISEELYKESGDNLKVKIMRFGKHMLFPIENRLYRLLKM